MSIYNLFLSKRNLLVALSLLCSTAHAIPKNEDIHKNDYQWLQFNLMQSVDAKIPYNIKNDTYLEIELGGRSGFLDLYAYVDFFDIFNSSSSDRHGDDNFFAKISPRISLDTLFNQDFSFGPVNELYIASVTNIGDRELFEQYIGLGTDVTIPFFNKIGVNAYARYVRENYGADNESSWDGYMLSTNWSTPVYQFHNDSYINYQGYLDYQFAANKLKDKLYSNNALEWYNGIYWHTDRYAIGYGLKYFHNMALIRDNAGAGRTSGIGHYFSLSYKF